MEPTSKWSGIVGKLLMASVVLTAFWLTPGFHLHGAGWIFLSSLATVLALAALVTAGREGGWRLAGRVALVYFGVAWFNVFDELLVFRLPGITTRTAAGQAICSLAIAAVFVPLMVWLFGRMRREPGDAPPAVARRGVAAWMWRIGVGAILYLVFYFVAGFLVFPFVKSFYVNAHIEMPSFGPLILMEVFRGLVYVGLAIVATRGMTGRRGRAALAVGLALSVFGGIAPLLMPNPILPGYVRLAHGFEVGISNFAYGVVLACLFTPPATARSGVPLTVQS